MRDNYNWYVLYTKTNTEARVISDFTEAFKKRKLDFSVELFCPETEIYYRKSKGGNGSTYKKRPLFPNYVFIETDMPEKDFSKEFSDFIYKSNDIIRLLKYGTGRISIEPEERMRFEYLFKGKRCLDRSVGIIEGDVITVTAGPLMGCEGLISHINRHNRTATINVEMFGGVIEAKVALEIIDKR
ncbi:MAG: antitermination protein NusG [Clostridiales bacterium]|nr:antitermination protein NusG [Clostridiales bacterium]